MAGHEQHEITQLLLELDRSDPIRREALDRLFNRVDAELRRLARCLMHNERRNHTLQPTALVNEAYLRLVGAERIGALDRAHFFAIAARAMRQILVDHARRKGALKRGGGWERVSLDDRDELQAPPEIQAQDLIAALDRLAEMDPRLEKVVVLRFFSGLKVEEVAQVLGVTARTVYNDWRVAKMWLAREFARDVSD
jgi:RNA polymerase sigma factor (TIGR02999 family)